MKIYSIIMAVLFAIAWHAQLEDKPKIDNKVSSGVFTPGVATAISSVVFNSPDAGTVQITCDEWNPKPKGCKIQDGKTLDDLTQAMFVQMKSQNAENRGLQDENNDLQHYLYAYTDCISAKKKSLSKPQEKK